MVSTRQSTKSREVAQEGASSGDSGEDYDPGGRSGPATARSSKSRASITPISKQKGKQPEKRRYGGKLSRSPVVPLDVLYEVIYGLILVAGWMPADALVDILSVHPADLLRTSWTNKTFHNTLTSKSSRRIWVAVFNNIPEARRPPPCPEDLTEIGYANLLYNPCCMVCVRENLSSHG